MSQKAIDTARSLESMASTLQRDGKYRLAEEPLLTAIGIWKLVEGPESLDALNDEMSLAVSYRRRGDVDLAIPILERVSAALCKRFSEPECAGYYRKALNNLGIAYRIAGFLEKARASLGFCLSLLELNPCPDREETIEHARVLDNLAVVTLALEEFAAAEVYASRSLAAWVDLHGDDHLDSTIARSNLGVALLRQGRIIEAREHIERSHAGLVDELGEVHPTVAGSFAILAELALREGDAAGAVDRAERSLDICQGCALPADHHQVVAAQGLIDAATATFN